MCLTAMVSPDDLPNSLIPTSNLYKLVCAYEAAYAELLAQDLVRTGNPKTNKKIH
jgi:hypothetical protein